MEVSTYKANGIFAKELEDELMKFTMKSEEYGVQGQHLVKQTEEVQKNSDDDVEVDITECTKSMGDKAVAREYQDKTESEGSSSFDNSDSDFENVALGDSEALSDFSGDAASALEFVGFGDNFRRKKLTPHWRSFIQPIMWRCKWTELQIKKLQSLAQHYDRELEAHNKRKQILLENSTLVDSVKSLPFSHVNGKSDLCKRKKRRMTEATTDISAYVSCHNLFSYYENRKSSTEGTPMSNLSNVSAIQKANMDDDFWANDDPLSFAAGDDDNSLEDILRKIEFLQSQAAQLRSRVDRVISENAEKFSFADKLSLPMHFDGSPVNDGSGLDVGTYIASQLISEYNMGDELVPESAVTNHGDGVPNSNANIDHGRFADAYRNVEDGVLIDNRRVKEEMNNFEEVIINPIENPPADKDGSVSKINNPSVSAEPDLHKDDQPPAKLRSIAKITTAPRSKRKRGRKRSARRQSRRSTG